LLLFTVSALAVIFLRSEFSGAKEGV
jgi:hypothetical protein